MKLNDEDDFILSYIISMFSIIILWIMMVVISTFFIDYSNYVITLKGIATTMFLLLSSLIVMATGFIKCQIEIRVKEGHQTK